MKYVVSVIIPVLFSMNLYGKEIEVPDYLNKYFNNPEILGNYRLHYFGFNVYDIQTIIEKSDLKNYDQSKIAIQIRYNRDIDKDDLMLSSFEEMSQVSGVSEVIIKEKYRDIFEKIYSNVKKGDQKVAICDGKKLILFHNKKLNGKIDDSFFAKHFIGMWLSEKASRQVMRKKLLNLK